jgi:ABC-type polysaccharide/polyol phosphate export permease
MNSTVPSDSKVKARGRGSGSTSTPASEAGVVQKDTSIWQVSRERRLIPDLWESLRNPEFWALSAWLDIVVTYRRSRLGVIWLLMPSAVYIWGVGSLFAGLWGMPISQFVAYLALGWTVFTVMSSVTMQSTRVLFSARSFIMDGRMRLTDFVLRSMAKAVFHFLMAMPMTIIAVAIYPNLQALGALTIVPAAALILINTFTAGVVFSLLGARFPDFHEVVSNVFRLMFLATPIIWQASHVSLHSPRGLLMVVNPFYHLIAVFRGPLLGLPMRLHSWEIVGALTIFGIALAVFLYRRYARLVPIWL